MEGCWGVHVDSISDHPETSDRLSPSLETDFKTWSPEWAGTRASVYGWLNLIVSPCQFSNEWDLRSDVAASGPRPPPFVLDSSAAHALRAQLDQIHFNSGILFWKCMHWMLCWQTKLSQWRDWVELWPKILMLVSDPSNTDKLCSEDLFEHDPEWLSLKPKSCYQQGLVQSFLTVIFLLDMSMRQIFLGAGQRGPDYFERLYVLSLSI